MKKAGIWFIILFLLILASGHAELVENEREYPVIVEWANFPDLWTDFSFSSEKKLLNIWMPDIRDADAAVVTYGDNVWLIDCGDERAARRLVILLRQIGITHIDRLFNTHPHHDHLNGLELVAETADIDELLICFDEDSTEHMKRAVAFCNEKSITISHYYDEDDFSMGDQYVNMHIWRKEQDGFRINDLSAQMKLTYGERSMLFMADMEKPGQRLLLEKVGAEKLKADIIKYPHHGKLTMDDDFLNAVRPRLAVITNYRQFGESYTYLKDKGVNIVYTNRDKLFLHIATDGNTWICEYIPVQQ